jgi:chromosome segregation ATPase
MTMEIFDKYGRFCMPAESEIASLDANTQERFAAVQSAASDLEAATASRVTAEQAVTDAIAERENSETNLRTLRPKISQVQNAKDWILSQRAQ